VGFLGFLIDKANATVVSPTWSAVSLGDAWKSRAETALQRASKALDFESNDEMEKASEEWKKLFGDDFPKAERSIKECALTSDKILALRAAYPSQKEEFLDRKEGIGFRIDSAYDVKIDARVEQNGFRPGWLSQYLQRRLTLLKLESLVFSIRENTVPAPYDVFWKVRNFGDEARRANDLRGEISRDRGFGKKEERTKYFGEHYVECYVVKDGVCVGMDGILVPIGSDY
jgi:hypothetical protein